MMIHNTLFTEIFRICISSSEFHFVVFVTLEKHKQTDKDINKTKMDKYQ